MVTQDEDEKKTERSAKVEAEGVCVRGDDARPTRC
jgi:hypothetical protein